MYIQKIHIGSNHLLGYAQIKKSFSHENRLCVIYWAAKVYYLLIEQLNFANRDVTNNEFYRRCFLVISEKVQRRH